MNGNKIMTAIYKQCGKFNLTEWCEDKGFSEYDFKIFLEYGANGFDYYQKSEEEYRKSCELESEVQDE